MIVKLGAVVSDVGARVVNRVGRLGFASRFFWTMLGHSGTALRRFPLNSWVHICLQTFLTTVLESE